MNRDKSNSAQLTITAWFDRFFAIPGLLVTSAAIYSLLALSVIGYRGSEDVLAWTQNNTTQITVAVQVFSQILGFILVQVLCLLLKNGFMIYGAVNAFPIYMTQFVQAASTPRMTWSLPWNLCSVLVLVLFSSFVPAPLWAASMSPLSENRTENSYLTIPSFDTANLSTIFVGNLSTATRPGSAAISEEEARWETPQGTFSFDMYKFKGAFLQSASGASVGKDGLKQHTKLDQTGYSYNGRSYGTGGVSGFESFSGIRSPSSFTYNETGLKAEVKCFYNTTIDDTTRWMTVYKGSPGTLVQLVGYDAYGNIHFYTYYAKADVDFFGWINGQIDNKTSVLSMSVLSVTPEDERGFNALNNIQCDFAYTPDEFAVTVDTVRKTINSTANNRTGLPWPRYASAVVFRMNAWMWQFTISDNCVGGSQIATSLVANANRLRNSTGLPVNEVTLRATEDFLQSLVDNILVMQITTRMVSHATDPVIDGFREGTTRVIASVQVPSVIFGDQRFIIAVAVLNTLIVIAYLIELIRTRVWSALPAVDLANLSDIIISAAKGGIVIAEKDSLASTHSRARKTSPWAYSRAEPFTDNTRIYMRPDAKRGDMPALVPLLEESEVVAQSDDHVELQHVRRKPVPQSDTRRLLVLEGMDYSWDAR